MITSTYCLASLNRVQQVLHRTLAELADIDIAAFVDQMIVVVVFDRYEAPSSLNYYHFQIKIHYGLVIRHHLLQMMMAMQLVVLGPFGNKCVCLQ